MTHPLSMSAKSFGILNLLKKISFSTDMTART